MPNSPAIGNGLDVCCPPSNQFIQNFAKNNAGDGVATNAQGVVDAELVSAFPPFPNVAGYLACYPKVDGARFFNTTTGQLEICHNGSWIQVGSPVTLNHTKGSGVPTATNPVSPNANDFYTDISTTPPTLHCFNGSTWISYAGTSNSLVKTVGTNAPSGTNPPSPNAGDIHINSGTTPATMYCFNGTTWIEIGHPDTNNFLNSTQQNWHVATNAQGSIDPEFVHAFPVDVNNASYEATLGRAVRQGDRYYNRVTHCVMVYDAHPSCGGPKWRSMNHRLNQAYAPQANTVLDPTVFTGTKIQFGNMTGCPDYKVNATDFTIPETGIYQISVNLRLSRSTTTDNNFCWLFALGTNSPNALQYFISQFNIVFPTGASPAYKNFTVNATITRFMPAGFVFSLWGSPAAVGTGGVGTINGSLDIHRLGKLGD